MRTKRLALVVLLACAASSILFAQQEGDRKTLVYGPRAGYTYILTSKKSFTADMRHIFGGARSYYPAFTEIGLAAVNLIPLGETDSSLTIEQNVMLGGLDQQILIPSVKLLLGVRTGFGTTAGLGPFVSIGAAEDGVELRFSLAYSLTWSFTVRDISVPVSFTFVPWPAYENPRMTLSTGVDFAVVD